MPCLEKVDPTFKLTITIVADGLRSVLNTSKRSVLRNTPRIMADALLYLLNISSPIYLWATSDPGGPGLLAVKHALEGYRGLYRIMEMEHEDNMKAWRQGSRSLNYHHPAGRIRGAAALQCMFHRAIRVVPSVECPYLVCVADNDTASPTRVAIQGAELAPRGEWMEYHGKHFDAFLRTHPHEACVEAMLEFLDRIGA